MNIENIIIDLNNYITPIDKDLKKELYKTSQLSLEDGSIGIIINKLLDENLFEGYLYIKRKDKIASPLMYKGKLSKEYADQYFEELNNMINNENIDYIIGKIKSSK